MSMEYVSIKLSKTDRDLLDSLILMGESNTNYSEIIHLAIEAYAEEQAIKTVLESKKGQTIKGNLRDLLLDY